MSVWTYSGNVYNSSPAGTTIFPLTSGAGNPIEYLERSHIHVSDSADSGQTWVELSTPGDYSFNTAGTEVILVNGIADGVFVKVERQTPYLDEYVNFQSSSLLTADQLNTAELFSVYVDQELSDQLNELNGGGPGAAVKGITGVVPVQVDETDQQNPVVSVDQLDSTANPNTALTSDTDLLSAKAVDAFYSQIVGSGAGYPAGSVGKDGKLRIDPSGPIPNLYYWSEAGSTWVQLPTKGDTGSQGPVGPAPGLQSPAADASNVPLKGDGTLGDATVSVDQDGSGDLKFSFGVPVGETGATGAVGPIGPGSTVDAGSATSLAYDAAPTVDNSGTNTAAVFNFGIPKGMPQKVGIAGIPPTSIAGSPVKPGDLWLDDNTLQLYVYYRDPSADEYWVSVSRMGEQGPAATVDVGVTRTGAPGTNASVVNTGTSGAAVLDFTIPEGRQGVKGDRGDDGTDSTVPGPPGQNATVDVETTSTLGPGNDAYVNNVGTTTNALLRFGIPKGDTGLRGEPGEQGNAGTVYVEDTITLPPGEVADVVNTGTNTEAKLIFYIPEGEQGLPGSPQEVKISEAPPTQIDGRPVRAGDLWFNSSNAQLYAYYVDPSSDEYWVSTARAAPGTAQVGTTPAANPANGQFFYDTANSRLRIFVNGIWIDA